MAGLGYLCNFYMLSGLSTSAGATIASENNMGPGLNEIGPAGNYAGLSTAQLWICTLAMLLGRLEMLSFLVLFTRGYWRK